jgi:hypothetical protein
MRVETVSPHRGGREPYGKGGQDAGTVLSMGDADNDVTVREPYDEVVRKLRDAWPGAWQARR